MLARPWRGNQVPQRGQIEPDGGGTVTATHTSEEAASEVHAAFLDFHPNLLLTPHSNLQGRINILESDNSVPIESGGLGQII